MAVAASQIPSLRAMLKQIHLWIGIMLCIPLVLLGLSGSILVYDEALLDWLGPETAPVAAGAAHSPGEILAAAQAASDKPTTPTMIRMPVEAGEPAVVRLVPQANGRPAQAGPQAGMMTLSVDPVSLAILSSAPPPAWLRWIHNLHGNLLVTGRDGRVLVGWFGIAMLVLGASGLVMWWPNPRRWRAAFRVSRGARGFRLHRELHGAVGLWSWIIFMIVSLSGVYLAFPEQVAAVIHTASPGTDPRAALTGMRVEPVQGVTPLGLDGAIVLARRDAPDVQFISAFLPARPDQPLRLNFRRPDDREGAPAMTVLVDPWRQARLATVDPQNLPAGDAFLAWQRGLHTGAGLGGIYRFLVFLSGLIIPLFAVTGISMWLLQRRMRARTPVRPPLMETAE